MFDYVAFVTSLQDFLTEAVAHYEESAPRVAQWADDLYIRAFDASEGKPETVTLADICAASRLCVGGLWEQPNSAQNRLYHHLDRAGRATTGWLDF